MVKTERLLNLVIALVNTRRFRSASWIHRNVAGYVDAPTDEAFSRMFERDKAELRELNVPLETDGEDGYRIPPHEFSLPELNFTPAETAAVGLAARLWSTTSLASAGEQALRKLREAATDQPGEQTAAAPIDGLLQPRVRTADPAFGPLQAATVARRQVRFGYRKDTDAEPMQRRVQPWGLVSYHGRWFLIGYDLDRKGQRTFRLSRISGAVTVTGKSGAYSVPSDLDLLEQVRRHADPPARRTARVRIRPGRAVGLRRRAELVTAAELAADAATGDLGWDLLDVPIAGLWETARAIAAAGADVQVVGPDDLRDAVIHTLRGALRLGKGGAQRPGNPEGSPR